MPLDPDDGIPVVPDDLDFTAQVIEWHIRETREEMLKYAGMMEKAAQRPSHYREAKGLLMAARMLREVSGVT